ncbi:MAG: hypothetical protein P9F19_15935 [Candidatus Contendobacter sp.]|nr:hypothetical protein [Candidatus Contendobacter sp.]MDG4558862.1 hypothetical protein [Candidatus Contendobacter sp.]
MSLNIRYEIDDQTGDDHRAGTLECWTNEGLFSAENFTPPLLDDHDYTVRVAVELYGGGLTPWSSAQRISAIEQEITALWLQDNGATAYIGWTLADPSIAPPIDLQLQINGSDWIDLPNDGGTTYYPLDARQFAALTGNAYLGQTVTLRARARLIDAQDWLESDEITSPGSNGLARVLFGWSLSGSGLMLSYARPPNTSASVWLSIDGGAPFQFSPSYPAGKHWLTYPDWRVRIPPGTLDGQSHDLQFRIRETANGQTAELWSLTGPLTIDPLPVLTAPSVHAVEWVITQGVLYARVTFKPIPSNASLTVSLQLDGGSIATQTLSAGQNTALFPVTDDDRGYRLARITAQARDTTGAESPAIVHAALLYRGYPQPMPIPAFNVQLLRQGDDVTPDRVRLTWTPVPGQLAELFATYTPGTDYRKTTIYPLGYVDSSQDTVTLDNTRAHFPKTGQPLRITYGIRPYDLIAGYGVPTVADPIQIRAENPEATPPPPDANTAQRWNDEDLLTALEPILTAAFPTVPPTLRMLLAAQTLSAFKDRIKAVVATGGRITLQDFGIFAAHWKSSRVGKTLTYTERGIDFTPSPGFRAGVKDGTVLTDAEAEETP